LPAFLVEGHGAGRDTHHNIVALMTVLLLAAAGFAVARDEARVVGFALGMFGHGVLHVLRYARDPAADDDARLYGNLVFADAVRQALALGCTRVHFGKASHLAKAQRGCRYEEGIVFARCTNDSEQPVLEAAFREVDAANRERFARLIAPPTPAAAGAR